MKTRLDFVSNSSSCSFVVACPGEHLHTVAKDLAKACSNPHSTYHNKKLAKENQLKLDFCLDTFQLAFLGELLLETKEELYSLDHFKKMFSRKDQTAKELEELAIEEWQYYKDTLRKVAQGNYSEFDAKSYGRDKYDAETDTALHYEDVVVSNVIVSNNVMDSDLRRSYWDKNNSESTTYRIESLLKLARAKVGKEYDYSVDPIGSIEIYQITQNTIDNTRDLIAAGHSVRLEKWEDLDRLQEKLSRGDKIFYVNIASSGDGCGDFHIYSEDGADDIGAVSGIEVLHSESM